MSIRVLLVDDHAVVREGVRAVLARDPDVEVVGEAADGRALLGAAASLRPDVVVTGIDLPVLNGVDATRQLVEAARAAGRAPPRVLCLTARDERAMVEAMLAAGAQGYVLKTAPADELLRAVRSVARGDAYLSPAISTMVIAAYAQGPVPPGPNAFGTLTGREREVLQLLAEGLSTKEIASRLHLSARTVAAHREKVMKKLDLHGVAELTRYAIREGVSSL